MVQIAQPAIGVQIYFGNGLSPESFTLLSNYSDITGLGLSATVVDVTSHSSVTVPWRQKLPTLLDSGDISFKMFFIPGDPTQKSFLALFATRGQGSAGNPIDFQLKFPDVNHTTWLFSGFITKFSQMAPVAGVLEAQVTITTTGAPTFPA